MKLEVRSLIAIALVMMLSAAVAAPALADEASAKQSFVTFCAKCHGENGKGDGAAGSSFKVKPQNFTDCARMTKVSDDTLFKVIKDGGASAGLSADMPAWKDGFEDSDIKDLVAYVRSFCKK